MHLNHRCVGVLESSGAPLLHGKMLISQEGTVCSKGHRSIRLLNEGQRELCIDHNN
jgi:hypothetical protein